MKQPIIGQKVNDEAIDSLIDLLEGIADANAVFYVGYPVAASVDSPITVPALLISEKYGLVCFDVVPSANGGDIPALKLKQRSIVLALNLFFRELYSKIADKWFHNRLRSFTSGHTGKMATSYSRH